MLRLLAWSSVRVTFVLIVVCVSASPIFADSMASDKTSGETVPDAIISVVGFPIGFSVDVPVSSKSDVRLSAQLPINTGATGQAEVGGERVGVLLAQYFQERTPEWPFDGGFWGPFATLEHDEPSGDSVTGGVETGYGWQSRRGFFLLLDVGIGYFHKLDGTFYDPDQFRLELGFTLGYRLNKP